MAHAATAAPIDIATDDTSPVRRAPARERWSWALYDFANTIFSMNIATLYFNLWLISDLGASNSAIALGNGVSSALVALSIPILGAISDVRRRRVPWVIWLTLIAVAATFAIGILGQQMVPLYGEGVLGGTPRPADWHIGGAPLVWIVVAFIVANYAYQGALPFYNAMLPELAPVEERGRLSGLGTAVGYVGSIVGVVMIAPFFNGSVAGLVQLPPSVTGALRTLVPFTSHAGRVSTFVPTALLFLLFSIPFFLFCRDHDPAPSKQPIPWREAFRSLLATVRDSRRHPGALRFIIASFMYQDAIGTIISFMAVYAVEAMGFQAGTEVRLFVILTVPAVFGSYLAGILVDRIGPKRTIMLVIAAWIALLIAMILAPSRAAFWAVGFGIGLIYGGVWTAERPLLLTLIPDKEAGRFFGLMVLSARAAAVLGPFIWAAAVDGLTPHFGKAIAYRAAVGTVAVGMMLSLVLLAGVPDRFRGRSA